MLRAAGVSVLLVAASAVPATGAAPVGGVIRVDQVGYLASESKQAYLLTPGRPRGGFELVDSRGKIVREGRVGKDRGRWNSRYRHVYVLDFSGLRTAGSYRIKLGKITSPKFRIDPQFPSDLTAGFFTTQRDGADVIAGELGRKPAHLNDRKAQVYAWPKFNGADTDQVDGRLKKLKVPPVDVEGGWFDAGDFLKFTHTSAFSTMLLWAARRDGRQSPELDRESRHGLEWLGKMWDGRSLYIQVGLGGGDKQGTFVGDHDTWRLPEKDDKDKKKGHQYLRNRPVFRAGAPGKKISPNLAGRVSAAFAMAAQVEPDEERARTYLETAAQLYGAADTKWKKQLVTALPHDFYPESVWHDDMELGGVELALAARRLGDARADAWLAEGKKWAAAYLKKDSGKDTFNLYDVSALAHADLYKAAGAQDKIAPRLVKGLKSQLSLGIQRAQKDPFRAGAIYTDFDAVPHTFGLAATALAYRKATGDTGFSTFATHQRNWALGANAWGTGFVIGAGTTFERCPQHVVANLKGRLDGKHPVATGAVVNGPNGEEQFADGLGEHSEGMRECGRPWLAKFDGHGSRYVDDVRSWQTSEPALDFTAVATYALSLF